MKILEQLVTNGWDNFWASIGSFFSQIWESMYKFWIKPDEVSQTPYLASFLFAIAVLVIGCFLVKLINFLVRKALGLGKKKFIKEKTLKNFIANTLKVTGYVIVFIIFMSILGVNLTGISTIFSSAILAVGLSLQDIIGNFASGLIILTSKPFVSGDYISFPDAGVEGTVVDVRFLTTVLTTVDNQQIVIPNKNVTSSSIMNYSTNPTRRINIVVGITYDSDVEEVKKILLKIVKADKRVLKDPAPVAYLVKFNSSSLDVSCRCWVSNDMYWSMLFNFNELILNEFRKNNVSFAFNRLDIYDVNGKSIDFNKINTKISKAGK